MKTVQEGTPIPPTIIREYDLPSFFEHSQLIGYKPVKNDESWIFMVLADGEERRIHVEDPLIANRLILELEEQLRSEISEKEQTKWKSKAIFSSLLTGSSILSAVAFTLSYPFNLLAAEGYTAEFRSVPLELLLVIAGLCFALFALASTFALVRWTLFDLISSTHALR